MSRLRHVLVPAALLSAAAPAAADQVSDMMPEAQRLARQWRADAQLVDIQVSGYGFAMPPGPGPLKSDNTPKLAYFYFRSPSSRAGEVLRVTRTFNFPPEQRQFVAQHPEMAAMRSELAENYAGIVPWQTPVPAGTTSAADAVARAEKSGLEEDCAGTNLNYGCAVVHSADLHMYIVGAGRRLPVWRVNFGQDAKAHEIVRLIDAADGKLITNCRVPGGSATADAQGNTYLECR